MVGSKWGWACQNSSEFQKKEWRDQSRNEANKSKRVLVGPNQRWEAQNGGWIKMDVKGPHGAGDQNGAGAQNGGIQWCWRQ